MASGEEVGTPARTAVPPEITTGSRPPVETHSRPTRAQSGEEWRRTASRIEANLKRTRRVLDALTPTAPRPPTALSRPPATSADSADDSAGAPSAFLYIAIAWASAWCLALAALVMSLREHVLPETPALLPAGPDARGSRSLVGPVNPVVHGVCSRPETSPRLHPPRAVLLWGLGALLVSAWAARLRPQPRPAPCAGARDTAAAPLQATAAPPPRGAVARESTPRGRWRVLRRAPRARESSV